MEVPGLWGQRKEGGRKDVMGFLGKTGSKTGKMASQRARMPGFLQDSGSAHLARPIPSLSRVRLLCYS